jgi:RNA polymerase sigma-70 factor (ECF subfamily)
MSADTELMRRIAARDEAAFAGLVESYGARLYTVALRLLGSPTDAEDAVQRAFLRCFTSAGDYRPEWAVSTWLYRILTNLCIDELRRRAARGRHEEGRDLRDAGGRDADGRAANGHAAGEAAAERLDVARAMQRVPREARILMTLCYVDGLGYGELARIRGVSVNTVKSQLARAKAILRAALGDRAPRRPAPRPPRAQPAER